MITQGLRRVFEQSSLDRHGDAAGETSHATSPDSKVIVPASLTMLPLAADSPLTVPLCPPGQET
jgi:hypothetical protein